jgi:hypothetical protein
VRAADSTKTICGSLNTALTNILSSIKAGSDKLKSRQTGETIGSCSARRKDIDNSHSPCPYPPAARREAAGPASKKTTRIYWEVWRARGRNAAQRFLPAVYLRHRRKQNGSEMQTTYRRTDANTETSCSLILYLPVGPGNPERVHTIRDSDCERNFRQARRFLRRNDWFISRKSNDVMTRRRALSGSANTL